MAQSGAHRQALALLSSSPQPKGKLVEHTQPSGHTAETASCICILCGKVSKASRWQNGIPIVRRRAPSQLWLGQTAIPHHDRLGGCESQWDETLAVGREEDPVGIVQHFNKIEAKHLLDGAEPQFAITEKHGSFFSRTQRRFLVNEVNIGRVLREWVHWREPLFLV